MKIIIQMSLYDDIQNEILSEFFHFELMCKKEHC